MDIRIGQGLDVHRFVAGRRLVIGGIEIPYHLGLDGHSDADVLLHAIIDALLGATGRGDIGTLFPDTESQWKNADSRELLRHAWGEVKRDGWSVINIDCTLLAQVPRLLPHIEAMKEAIAPLLEIDPSRIGIKATTTEKLGAVGREEGIVASAVALLRR